MKKRPPRRPITRNRGTGLQKSAHPGRTFDPRIHQGTGGVFFVFTEEGVKGYRVREFYPSGHTSHLDTRVYRTLSIAHRVASMLSHLPSQME